jgi:hypothetical protein
MYMIHVRTILWHIDSLLGNNGETRKEITAIAMQRNRKYATILEPLPGSGPQAAMEVLLEAVLSMWSTPKLYPSTYQVLFS